MRLIFFSKTKCDITPKNGMQELNVLSDNTSVHCRDVPAFIYLLIRSPSFRYKEEVMPDVNCIIDEMHMLLMVILFVQ